MGQSQSVSKYDREPEPTLADVRGKVSSRGMITHVRFVIGMDNSDAMTEFITPRRETCVDGRSLLPGKILYSTRN